MPGPSTLTITSAKSRAGSAKNTSMIRMITLSNQPPMYAESVPSSVPRMPEIATDASDTRSEFAAPSIKRLATSRPNRSVPSTYCALGPVSRSRTCCSSVG